MCLINRQPTSAEEATKSIRSLERGLRDRQDDLDSLSRRIDNLLIEKHQAHKGSRGLARSTLAGSASSARALEGPARLVANALNAELDGDLLLRAVRANRQPGGLLPRPCGKTSIEQVMKSGAASKFLTPKVELRRPKEKRAERSPARAESYDGPSSIPAVPTLTSIASSSAFTATTPTTSESKSSSSAPPAPLKPFDFGLTTTTSGLTSQSRSGGGGLRPLNKHQREKNEVKVEKVKVDGSAGKSAGGSSASASGGTPAGAFS